MMRYAAVGAGCSVATGTGLTSHPGLFRGGLFVLPPPRLGFVPPPRRWEQGRTTRPEGGLPGWSPADRAVPESVGGGLPSLPPTAPAFSFAFCPHPPNPLPRRGRGRPRLFHARGSAPCIPGAEPTVRRQSDRKQFPMSSAGSQGEGGPGERNFGV